MPASGPSMAGYFLPVDAPNSQNEARRRRRHHIFACSRAFPPPPGSNTTTCNLFRQRCNLSPGPGPGNPFPLDPTTWPANTAYRTPAPRKVWGNTAGPIHALSHQRLPGGGKRDAHMDVYNNASLLQSHSCWSLDPVSMLGSPSPFPLQLRA